jgi:hypothetical protein
MSRGSVGTSLAGVLRLEESALNALTIDELTPSGAMRVAGFHESAQSRFEHQTLTAIARDHRYLAVRRGDSLLGGITIIPFASISDDSAVTQHWTGDLRRPGLRLARLWTNGSQKVLATLFRATFEHLKAHIPDAYLFGVLSVSLGFARKKKDTLTAEGAVLGPRIPLDACSWPADEQPTSDGERLLCGYFRLGAKVLGPPSGDPSTTSVKLLLGIDLCDVRLARWNNA